MTESTMPAASASSAPMWPVSDLLLDPENPRLPTALRGSDQIALLKHMAAHYDLEELGWSMAERGYFTEEPLLVVPYEEDPSKRIVVEGNRRLATLKLLTDAAARSEVGKKIWDELTEFVDSEGHDLATVPVREYASSKELLEYLGFRHVSGLLAWEAEAKARYVFMLITDFEYTFEKAARTIGSRSDAIRRQFIAWSALEQARKSGVDVAPAVQRFGVYYRSLQNPGTREFLGLSGWLDGDPTFTQPLSDGGPERLAEFLGFIFGPRRVIKESRRLDDLAKVVTEPIALEILRSTRDVEAALREIPEDRNAVLGNLRLAYRNLATVNGQVFEFAGDKDLLSEAKRVRRISEQIINTLSESSPDEDD